MRIWEKMLILGKIIGKITVVYEKVIDTSCSVMANKVGLKTIVSEFDSH